MHSRQNSKNRYLQEHENANRIAKWQDHFIPLWGEIAVVPEPDKHFDAWVETEELGALRFNKIYHAAHSMIRIGDQSQIMDGRYYVLNISRAGSGLLRTQQSETRICPGHAVLSASTRANEFCVNNTYLADQMMVSHRLMTQFIPNPEEVYHLSWAKPSVRLDMLLGLISTMRKQFGQGEEKPEEIEFAVRNIMEFLAFVIQGEEMRAVSDESSVRYAHRLRVHKAISENLANPDLSPAGLAALCDISESYLHRIMAEAGPTPMECLRQARLNMAMNMLQSFAAPRPSVQQISYQVGFKSPSAFSRAFKIEFGMSPRDARQRHDESLLG